LPNHPLLSTFFGAGPESFRVVDLERAQGLVRDHVIFSLGYGRTPHGRALHTFGPLSAEGGRNRFALAMTRARRSMHVLSCFRPEDLDLDRLAHGAVDFYELLDRELSGNSNLGTPASRAVASEQALGEDPLVADLGERLRARGARVWHLYDGVLDIAAAADPVHTIGREGAEIPTPVAIESDGTERYRRMSVRERSRLRPQLLERMGWRYMSLWTIEVFTDPSSCADRIGSYLGLENHIPRSSSQHGFLDMDVEQLSVDKGQPTFAPSPVQKTSARLDEATGGADSETETGKEVPLMEQTTSPEDGTEAESAASGDDTAEEASNAQAATVKPGVSGILPTKAAEDDPRRWGDESGYDHEQWLKEQKPPHWG
ncbi:AAA family ATPase, partial [Paenarthrobacter sp. CM16]|nr:AAA family ATPase [Paenarthrobacter sp. CM16]